MTEPTELVARLRELLAKTDSPNGHDMILREQRDTTMETLQADLFDAFDGYLVDPRPPGSPA